MSEQLFKMVNGERVPCTPEDIAQMLADQPTRQQIEARVRQQAKDIRTAIFLASGIDGLQTSALGRDDQATFDALEAIKQGLRDITKLDLSAAQTEAEMRALVLARYRQITQGLPASVQALVAAAAS